MHSTLGHPNRKHWTCRSAYYIFWCNVSGPFLEMILNIYWRQRNGKKKDKNSSAEFESTKYAYYHNKKKFKIVFLIN